MMQHPFIDFLIEHDLIPDTVAQQLTVKKNLVREPIGMIAVSHGLLTMSEIDMILDRQRHNDHRFGDIAVELGFLSRDQVERLVKIQEFRTSADLAEALILGGILSCEDASQYLGSFLVRDQEVAAMIADQ